MRKLSRKRDARSSLVKNLISSLVLYEQITTTQARAKAITPIMERYLTIAQQGTLSSNRLLRSKLFPIAAKKLHEQIAKRLQHPTGSVRVVAMGVRSGDGAPMARIELLLKEPLAAAQKTSTVEPAGKAATKPARSNKSPKKEDK